MRGENLSLLDEFLKRVGGKHMLKGGAGWCSSMATTSNSLTL